jgi:hypothetical protein
MLPPCSNASSLAKRYLLFSVAALMGTTQACNSTPDSPSPSPSDPNTSLLTAHPWHIVAFSSTDNTASPPKTEDGFSQFAAYRKDDTYRFNADQSLLFDEGALKKNAADPQTATGSWQFLNQQTDLRITLGKAVALGTTGITSSSTYTLTTLSPTTLRLTGGTQAQTVVITLSQ